MEDELTPPVQEEYRLVIVSDTSIRAFALHGTRWTIGRGRDCSLCLNDPAVSRKHLRVERHGDEFRFEDLGGVNPVVKDGQAVKDGTWAPGQTLVLGMTRLTLDRRDLQVRVRTDPTQTAVIAREELLPGAAEPPAPMPVLDPVELSRLLESMEWAVADLSSPEDVAEPLLQMALNLTGRRSGVLGMVEHPGGLRTLAAADRKDPNREIRLPLPLLRAALEATKPYLMTMQAHGEQTETLIVPLGSGPAGLLLLADAWPEAPRGQPGLRLANAVGTIVWQRLQETRARAAMQAELERLNRSASSQYECVLASGRYAGLRAALREFAGPESPVLLVGEAGANLDAVARYLHAIGRSSNGVFVAAHAADLLQAPDVAALFVAGDSLDLLARSRNGTLYLEGAEQLPAAAQKRLAAIVANCEYTSEGRAQHFEGRVVFGTTADPRTDHQGWVPELAALLDKVRFAVPPLRSDARDILAMAELVLADLGPTPDGRPRQIGDRAQRLLAEYPWPGNEEQLRAVIESAAKQAGNEPIAPRHLPAELQTAVHDDDDIESLEVVERRHIREVLARLGGNRARAAQALGIASSTLYEKIKRYQLDV